MTATPVLLPYKLPGPLDYATDTELPPGTYVEAPLRRGLTTGVVWDRGPHAPPPANVRLKKLQQVFDVPPMPERLRQFIDWVARYTLSAPGDVLAMALRVDTLAAPVVETGYLPGTGAVGKLSPARASVLALLQNGIPRNAAEITAQTKASAAVIRAMRDAGLLRVVPMQSAAHPVPDAAFSDYVLSDEQDIAAAALRKAVAEQSFQPILLDGVTGSGKTETYLEAVAECLRAGRQALVLLPEIALSSQWMQRFRRRFGCDPAVWHSDLTARARRLTWHGVARGDTRIVVGARSALFLPFRDLGLIIVDEEHETAFKQEEGVMYHARDMAVVRAKFEHAPVVLVSATPSLESLVNAQTGRYAHLTLHHRHGGARLPQVQLLDMRTQKLERGHFLAPALVEAVRETVARGEQALLFLNRRGYAPLTLCRACGHRIQCPNCTAWLVQHRSRQILTCHHCGHSLPMPDNCPACQAENSLAPIGPGVERIAEEAASLFPDLRRLVMASDTITSPRQAEQAAQSIAQRAVDLLIGTQIIAKGWHFPHLTFVGVVDADLGLAGGDLRAGERCVQLLHQVAGRAGRENAPGTVMLQSFSPEHPVMQAIASGDLAGFMAQEAQARRPGHWPPFGRLAALILSSDDAGAVDALGQILARAAPMMDGVMVLGPAPAPLAILRGRHRRRFLMKAPKDIALQPIIQTWLARIPPHRDVRIDVDMDPVSFM